MNNNLNQPGEFDAVLGGEAPPPIYGVVLGGNKRVKSSILTESLNRILKSLEEKDPEIALLLQPGLTRKEIDQITKDLPFKLPEELYELYQWRNGLSDDIGFGFATWNGIIGGFSSLEEAITDFQNLRIRGCLSNFLRIFLFSHQLGGDYYVVSIDEITYPVFHFNDKDENFSIQHLKGRTFFSSLTTLMYAIAECFERDAIYSYTNSKERTSLEYDKDKINAIIHKYKTGNFKIYRT
ncbi:MAG: SMI1/KNR4 family protein [Nostoc sp. DedQUE08]|uniref:SMI1/KNR4 family protein n=2 Tax=unclassified Nostoc TaxID=2593658 RepID=UPI002AD48BB2|nr:SMI1/KNR4 family protein [Nostoc sp. DedQUE08]MDZ8070981.1 SMI1/KNR4 family protein [Nostoc sp. DedQUE08]